MPKRKKTAGMPDPTPGCAATYARVRGSATRGAQPRRPAHLAPRYVAPREAFERLCAAGADRHRLIQRVGDYFGVKYRGTMPPKRSFASEVLGWRWATGIFNHEGRDWNQEIMRVAGERDAQKRAVDGAIGALEQLKIVCPDWDDPDWGFHGLKGLLRQLRAFDTQPTQPGRRPDRLHGNLGRLLQYVREATQHNHTRLVAAMTETSAAAIAAARKQSRRKRPNPDR